MMYRQEPDKTAIDCGPEPCRLETTSRSGSEIYRSVSEEADALLRAFESQPLDRLLAQARALREEGHGRTISYSRKVFIPLTRLCRDTCGYCTFATTPSKVAAPYLSPDDVLAIARAGQRAGCHEALFTLGDKPELRYEAARKALEQLGYTTTTDYLAAMCELVLRETGLLPHVNAGMMTDDEIERLRAVSVSQGIMLESVSERLCQRGGPHFGSPDKASAGAPRHDCIRRPARRSRSPAAS